MSPVNNLESRVAVLEDQMLTLRASQAAMADDVREIRDAVLGAKGGWRVLIAVWGVGVGIGAALIKVIPMIFKVS